MIIVRVYEVKIQGVADEIPEQSLVIPKLNDDGTLPNLPSSQVIA